MASQLFFIVAYIEEAISFFTLRINKKPLPPEFCKRLNDLYFFWRPCFVIPSMNAVKDGHVPPDSVTILSSTLLPPFLSRGSALTLARAA